jgi:hypothetical protein
MTSPLLRVQVGFLSAPDDPVQLWTDITEDVRGWEGVSWSRGRREVTEHTEPGSATLRVSNTAGRYTWGNPASDLYPNVLPGKRIRIAVSLDGGSVWWQRWDGYVTGWPVAWAFGELAADPVITVTATDRLSRFGRLRSLVDGVAEQLGTSAGTGDVWRLG